MNTQRKIKFRVWDSENGMMPVQTLYFDKNGDLAMPYHTVEMGVYIMQFTGLLDKNGKEIYEGDILHLVQDVVVEVIWGSERREPEGQILEVKWENGAWFLGEEMLWEWSTDSEIIGNIYENSTLLD